MDEDMIFYFDAADEIIDRAADELEQLFDDVVSGESDEIDVIAGLSDDAEDYVSLDNEEEDEEDTDYFISYGDPEEEYEPDEMDEDEPLVVDPTMSLF